MDAISVGIGKGVTWFGDGWRIFKNDWLMWILLTIVYFVILMLLSVIPFVGGIVISLINPALIGGLLYAANKAAMGERVSFNNLFYPLIDADVRNKVLVLGALQIAFSILCLLIVVLVMGGGIVMGLLTGKLAEGFGGSLLGAGLMGGMGFLLGLLIILLISLIFITAMYFAVPLVVFSYISPFEALSKSLVAFLKNILPLLLYGIVFIILFAIAMIPFGLGIIIFFPILVGSYYASYRDIFV